MTKYIAYTVAVNQAGLPNGFITSHFATDQSTLDGYLVVPLDMFNTLFKNNVTLIRQQEVNNGVIGVPPNTPVPVPRAASDAQHVPPDFNPPPPTSPANAELFNQFLAWVAAGKPGNPPSNS